MNLRQISGMGDSNQSYSGSERLHQVRLQAFHFQCGRNYFVPQLWLGNRFRFFYFQAGTSKAIGSRGLLPTDQHGPILFDLCRRLSEGYDSWALNHCYAACLERST